MRHLLPGGRLHFHDGPIDLILEAFGTRNANQAAYHAAAKRASSRFSTNSAANSRSYVPPRADDSPRPQGPIAQRHGRRSPPYAARHFITPMAAVAGAVADEILATMYGKCRRRSNPRLRK